MLRILPHLVADGPRQMALDEALLEAAVEPTLRTYAWDPPSLSLGYFQNHHDIATRVPSTLNVVRRITGGGAIWHEHEITYCLIGWLGKHGLPERMRDCYAAIHAGILKALAARGAHLDRQPASVGDRRYQQEPRCFASPATDDLVHPAGGKTLGSAGRDRAGKILIHGSLKLDTNPWDGPAVRGCGLHPDHAAEALVHGIVSALGLPHHDGSLTSAERDAAARIQTERYATPAWVEQRQGPRP